VHQTNYDFLLGSLLTAVVQLPASGTSLDVALGEISGLAAARLTLLSSTAHEQVEDMVPLAVSAGGNNNVSRFEGKGILSSKTNFAAKQFAFAVTGDNATVALDTLTVRPQTST